MLIIVIVLVLTLIIATALLTAGAGIASIIIGGELAQTKRDLNVTLGLVGAAVAGALMLLDVAQQHQGTVAPTTALLALLTLAVSVTLALRARTHGLI